jgi:hypothetical protein
MMQNKTKIIPLFIKKNGRVEGCGVNKETR